MTDTSAKPSSPDQLPRVGDADKPTEIPAVGRQIVVRAWKENKDDQSRRTGTHPRCAGSAWASRSPPWCG